jgi:hypothetical protein
MTGAARSTRTTPVQGACRSCRHWYVDTDRYRSALGECVHIHSEEYLQQTDPTNTCPSWQPLTKIKLVHPKIVVKTRSSW